MTDTTFLSEARQRMTAAGQWNDRQFIGRWWPVGCVALEITQRCNLDCSACYLSEHSELVKDLPLDEIYRRIDAILHWYGPRTNVQVTGGDPTLRPPRELAAIVRRISERGMRPALITNGIRAKRTLLQELADAGLVDVAFHVDMTQNRRGYPTETSLNAVRTEYIDRARGLPLSIMFNTTVFGGNLHEMPSIVDFFIRNSDVIRLASFQIHAETGRSSLGRRSDGLSIDAMQRQIETGVRARISFDSIQIGHKDCSRYGMVLTANGRAFDALDDRELVRLILGRMPHQPFDRRVRAQVIRAFAQGVLLTPTMWPRGFSWLARKLWSARKDLVAARGRITKLSFLIHSFMGACDLDCERIDSCTFMAATARGPVSMCSHNARRDDFILQPVLLTRQSGHRYWEPLSGIEIEHPAKSISSRESAELFDRSNIRAARPSKRRRVAPET